MRGDIKIGIIGRADNTGLGIETWEFCRHFPEAKTLIVEFESLYPGPTYKIYPARFNNPVIVTEQPNDYEIRAFLEGLDVLFTIETPYNRRTYQIAREMGVKTILRVNFEWLYDYHPDLFLVPSLYRYQDIPEPKLYLPFPVNRQVLPFKLRTKAKKFIHIAGNCKAGYDRNGTELFLKAIPYIKSDIEIIIKSQVPIAGIKDKRTRVDVKNYENYWDIWEDADVLVSPRRYAGQSLPLNEAMSRGLAIIMTDMEPQSQFLPKELSIKPKGFEPLMISRKIDMAVIDPKDIAKKIDEIANQDIRDYSKMSNRIAEAWSWESLKPKYEQIFKNICLSH